MPGTCCDIIQQVTRMQLETDEVYSTEVAVASIVYSCEGVMLRIALRKLWL